MNEITVDLDTNELRTGRLPPLSLTAGLAELAHALATAAPDYAGTPDLMAALYGRKPQTGFRMAIMRLRRAVKCVGLEIIFNPDKGYCLRRMAS